MGGKTKNGRESEKGRERNNKEREIKKNLKNLETKNRKEEQKGRQNGGEKRMTNRLREGPRWEQR